MSYEGWVMPAEVVLDTTPKRVTPSKGKGALGKWRTLTGNTVWALTQIAMST